MVDTGRQVVRSIHVVVISKHLKFDDSRRNKSRAFCTNQNTRIPFDFEFYYPACLPACANMRHINPDVVLYPVPTHVLESNQKEQAIEDRA